MESPPEQADSSDERPRAARRRRQSPARPRFLAHFPEHEVLSEAILAFESGDYAEVRRLCEDLLTREDDVELRRSATELLRRIEPDRLVVVILWGSFALLLLVILWAYGRAR